MARATERAVEWFWIAGGKGKERNERERARETKKKKRREIRKRREPREGESYTCSSARFKRAVSDPTTRR